MQIGEWQHRFPKETDCGREPASTRFSGPGCLGAGWGRRERRIRVFAGTEPTAHTWNQVAGWMVEELQKCVEHGQKYGVLIGIQNHWDFLKTSEQVLKIVQMVDSEWFGTIVDTGYFLTADPYKDMAAVAPYAVNWQVKEKVDGQEFRLKLDLKKLVHIAREAGYRGYLPIETLSRKSGEPDYDPQARAVQLLKELRAAIQETE